MKGPLTSIFDSLSDRAGVGARLSRAGRLVREAARDQKLAELGSFAVWEARHRLGVLPSIRYVTFTDHPGLRLEDHQVSQLDSSPSATQHWSRLGLTIRPAAHDWRVLAYPRDQEIWGSLSSDRGALWLSTDAGRSTSLVERFSREIETVFRSSSGTILVSVKGEVHRREDHGEAFHKSLELSTPESYLRHPYGITELPNGTLLLGEYGNVRRGQRWLSIANLYMSLDDGSTWHVDDVLKRTGANKHVHFVWYSQLLNRVLVSDGDNKKRLWISDPVSADLPGIPPLNVVNRFHVGMGGYTAVTEDGGRVLLGTDYMGGTNFLVRTVDGREYEKIMIPDPYRRSPIMQLLKRNSISGVEIWALLPFTMRGSPSLVMYSRDHGEHWTRVLEYGPRWGVQILGSSTHGSPTLYLNVTDRDRDERAVYEIGDGLDGPQLTGD